MLRRAESGVETRIEPFEPWAQCPTAAVQTQQTKRGHAASTIGPSRGDAPPRSAHAYPAVPMNAPRLRTCLTTAHTDEHVEFALDVLTRAGREVGLI